MTSTKCWINYTKCRRKIGQTSFIGIGSLLGLLVGFLCRVTEANDPTFILLLGLPGELWLSTLKCMVMPLIFSRMVLGVARMRVMPNGGPIGRHTMLFVLATTTIAAIEGLILSACIVAPFTVPPPSLETSLGINTTEASPSPTDATDVNVNVGNQLVGVLMSFIP